MNLFTQNFFARMFIVVDDMKTVRGMLEVADRDPNRLTDIRNRLAVLSKQVILLEETLGFLRESLDEAEIPSEPPEQAGRSLYERLQLGSLSAQLKRRVKDLEKNMLGARHELDVLNEMSAICSEEKIFKQHEAIRYHMRSLCELQTINERSATTLQLIQVILSGTLAFDILDRLTGDWTLQGQAWALSYLNPLVFESPGLWYSDIRRSTQCHG